MLKRKIYGRLRDWKAARDRDCLVLKGARQVGKTFIVDRFGRENYKSFIHIDFVKHPEHKLIFDGSLEASDIMKKLTLYVSDVCFAEGDTLIFLDGIHECPNSRTALKYLGEDGRFDVIASSDRSAEESAASVPVGSETVLSVDSLDFEEFMWACGVSADAVDILRGYYEEGQPVDPGVHERFMGLLRDYLVVGGMPGVVAEFIKTDSYGSAFAAQKRILEGLEDDIRRCSSPVNAQKIIDCYRSLPRQLSRVHTKFQYTNVTRDGNARKYEESLKWLSGSGLIKKCVNVGEPVFPSAAYEKTEQFKVYSSDTGLLTSMYGPETQSALVRDTLEGPARNGIYENLAFDMLSKAGIKLNYFKSETSTQEIEFLFERDGSMIPVEMKPRKGSSVSLGNYISAYGPPSAYKLVTGNLEKKKDSTVLPLYMAMFLGQEKTN